MAISSQVERDLLEQLKSLFSLPAATLPVATDVIPTETQVSREGDEEQDDCDIVEKLRTLTPCVVCRQVCEDAAMEIERLRMLTADPAERGDGIIESLNAAIVGSDPCGRSDCISPSTGFLAAVRDEMWRLRRKVSRATRLAAVAKKVWRNESGMQSLIHAVIAFERE